MRTPSTTIVSSSSSSFASISALLIHSSLLLLTDTVVGIGEGKTTNTNTTTEPVLYGYDMVSYFTKGSAVKGVADNAYEFLTQDCGVNDICVDRFKSTFYFENQENLETFKKDPWKYAPKYGGF
eukprot:g2402.t1